MQKQGGVTVTMLRSLATFVKRHRDILTFWAGLAVYFVVATALSIPCPIKFATGACCPGCGMSRALIALLTGDVVGAWQYHPLVFLLLPFAVLMIALTVCKKKKARRVVVFIGAGLLLAVYLYRVLVLHSDVVTVDFESGVFVRLLKRLCL